jgi:hypothetical protein
LPSGSLMTMKLSKVLSTRAPASTIRAASAS